MGGHEYYLLERHSKLRRHLSNFQRWPHSAYRSMSRRNGRSGPDRQNHERIQPCRFISGRQEEEAFSASISCVDFSWAAIDPKRGHQSQELQQARQPCLQHRVDYSTWECSTRNPEWVSGRSSDAGRIKSTSQIDSAAGHGNTGAPGNCRGESIGTSLRGESFGHSTHPSRQELAIAAPEWPADLRVREMPTVAEVTR